MQGSYWILDIVIKGSALSQNLVQVHDGMWLIFSADGLAQPFSTPKANPTGNIINWSYPARLILMINDMSRAYLYVTLCTESGEGSPIALARSRISLRSLPLGSPKIFKFPLMSVDQLEVEAAHVRMLATLSSFAPQAVSQTASYAIGGFPQIQPPRPYTFCP